MQRILSNGNRYNACLYSDYPFTIGSRYLCTFYLSLYLQRKGELQHLQKELQQNSEEHQGLQENELVNERGNASCDSLSSNSEDDIDRLSPKSDSTDG